MALLATQRGKPPSRPEAPGKALDVCGPASVVPGDRAGRPQASWASRRPRSVRGRVARCFQASAARNGLKTAPGKESVPAARLPPRNVPRHHFIHQPTQIHSVHPHQRPLTLRPHTRCYCRRRRPLLVGRRRGHGLISARCASQVIGRPLLTTRVLGSGFLALNRPSALFQLLAAPLSPRLFITASFCSLVLHSRLRLRLGRPCSTTGPTLTDQALPAFSGCHNA